MVETLGCPTRPLSKIEKLVRFTTKSFYVFDRNEIHIQAFVHFINGKLMSGHSSSSTFHHFQEFITSTYQKNRNPEFQKFKKWTPKVSGISKFSKIAIVRFP